MQDVTQPAGADQAPAEQTSPWPMKVPLRKPLKDKDANPVTDIVFREPTGADIAVCGCPVNPNWETGETTFNAKAMHSMMQRLSGIPLAFLNQIDPADWSTCAWKLEGFFLPDLAKL